MKTENDASKEVSDRFIEVVDRITTGRNKITKKVFAKSIGMANTNLYLVERGERAPTLNQVAMTIREYSVNPAWLFKGEGEMFCRNSVIDDIFERFKSEIKRQTGKP
ncbi:MAG: helix-turn-helix domain-containing protein [Prevotellaceae bacterium]|jgi:DNA-binding XRE family transcriptional regulator|nr:helix-turn-helix domain-containing protein [Prevotellaceae bacterium]